MLLMMLLMMMLMMIEGYPRSGLDAWIAPGQVHAGPWGHSSLGMLATLSQPQLNSPNAQSECRAQQKVGTAVLRKQVLGF